MCVALRGFTMSEKKTASKKPEKKSGAGSGDTTTQDGEQKKEIYTYYAPWPIYGMSWSLRADPRYTFRWVVPQPVMPACRAIPSSSVT